MSDTKDYYERLEIEKQELYRFIQDIADKRYDWIISIDEIEDFFEIIRLAHQEIIKE